MSTPTKPRTSPAYFEIADASPQKCSSTCGSTGSAPTPGTCDGPRRHRSTTWPKNSTPCADSGTPERARAEPQEGPLTASASGQTRIEQQRRSRAEESGKIMRMARTHHLVVALVRARCRTTDRARTYTRRPTSCRELVAQPRRSAPLASVPTGSSWMGRCERDRQPLIRRGQPSNLKAAHSRIPKRCDGHSPRPAPRTDQGLHRAPMAPGSPP